MMQHKSSAPSATPVWKDLVDRSDRDVLEAGTAPDPDPRPDVLVVGGGALGLGIAAMCVRAGLGSVQVVERGRLAGGVSGSAAGALAPGTHTLVRPPPFLELGATSLALHRELDAERATGIRGVDWLLTTERPPDPELGPSADAELLDAPAAGKREPALGDVEGAMLLRDQAHVDPLRLAAAFARRAGSVTTGVEVRSVGVDGSRVVQVATNRGPIVAGVVVLATGTEPRIDGIQPLCVASQTLKGHLLATEPARFRLRTFVAGLGIFVLQLPDGRLVAGGTEEPEDAEPIVRPDVVRRIGSAMHTLIPASARLNVTHAWCCFRPATADGLPVIDRYPGLDNVWVTAGHLRTGLLMAPATGRAIASWITTDTQPREVEAFGVARLL